MRRFSVIGNIVKDAEVKDVNSKKAINFSVACNESWKDNSGNKQEKAYYYNCTIWRDSNTSIAPYLTRGTKVLVEGSPDVEIFKDKEGEVKGAVKIIVSNVELLGGGNRPQSQNSSSGSSAGGNSRGIEDDLPF